MKQKGYTQEFVRKIEQGEKDIAEGKCTVIDVKDLWKSIGLTSHKNRKMRVYIIGKVSGLERQVYLNNFARAEKALSNAGFRTINPTRLCKPEWSWLRCMLKCLSVLIFKANAIYRTQSWKDSRGGKIEVKVAKFFHKKILA